MFSGIFLHQLTKSQAAAKGLICLFALIFFLTAALSSLPSLSVLSDQLEKSGLAGYSNAEDHHENRHEGALKHFTDRPQSEETSFEKSEPSENENTSDSDQKPVNTQKVAL